MTPRSWRTTQHGGALRAGVAQRAGSRELRVTYAGDGRYTLSPEQAEALTNEDSPACVLGGFQGLTARPACATG